jgi:hypothetical protein
LSSLTIHAVVNVTVIKLVLVLVMVVVAEFEEVGAVGVADGIGERVGGRTIPMVENIAVCDS